MINPGPWNFIYIQPGLVLPGPQGFGRNNKLAFLYWDNIPFSFCIESHSYAALNLAPPFQNGEVFHMTKAEDTGVLYLFLVRC
jgi:hypothetical protein